MINKLILAVGSLAILITLLMLSLMIGSSWISLPTVIDYVFHYSTTVKEHIILHILRMPRAIAVILIGANLSIAGCIMQALTRNPLASPSIFGINAGASFMIVLCTIVLPAVNGWILAGAGFAGGLLTVMIVLIMSVAIRGGKVEVRMALIGVVIQALLSSFTQGLLIFNEESASKILFWLAGSAAGVKWDELRLLAVVSIIGLIMAIGLSRSLSLISLGEDIARGLGQKIWTVRIVGSVIVILLAGISVSVVGPIGFVGLIVPHITRYLIGTDYRLLIPFAGVFGAILLTLADISSRFIHFPAETPVGIITALIGAPYFVYLARRQSRSSL
ncbi:iron ABC transporter permease [Paenibacillus sp. KACC 21273]|uniref:FecCD family ABC transporter permease n=1 Tax=Paenibacillus sp. KACC 21273 TaxID=3025665 RepID=UPI0023660273|nr:iron ABC transporter permease [Paenibacillus sp. KACC 21273]WDF50268.1 iron ABC transporter permease [Paenibacillus sp. KACC 21273]